jgi:SAM-dependent methyltransferase
MTDAHSSQPNSRQMFAGDVWDRISAVYVDEIERIFSPVAAGVIDRARLRTGERVLDLGTGTGSVALLATRLVGSGGSVTGVDISPQMIAVASARAREAGRFNLAFLEGSAEAIPCDAATFDVLTSSLCLMFVPDREAAARECARILRPGGRLVASVWAGPDVCDLARFQDTVREFSGRPVSASGPAALADPSTFVRHLSNFGIDATVDHDSCDFDLPSLDEAWRIFAPVAGLGISPERIAGAKAAIQSAMWSDPNQPRRFTNRVLYISGSRSG